jgi:hypothetical protein
MKLIDHGQGAATDLVETIRNVLQLGAALLDDQLELSVQRQFA